VLDCFFLVEFKYLVKYFPLFWFIHLGSAPEDSRGLPSFNSNCFCGVHCGNYSLTSQLSYCFISDTSPVYVAILYILYLFVKLYSTGCVLLPLLQ
jgi:hypothetical protein